MLDPDEPAEKREDERAAITLRVDYKRLNSFFADYTKNISKGGTFIRTSKPLEVGTEFVFVLSLPSHSEQLKLIGKVMWTVDDAAATDENPAGMGIRFVGQSKEEIEKVDAFVANLMQESLGEQIASKLMRTS